MLINIPLFDKDKTSIDAITICFIIICWVKNPPEQLIKHENVHIKQWIKQPLTYHIRYFAAMFKNKLSGMSWREAYLAIPYEVEARNLSKKIGS